MKRTLLLICMLVITGMMMAQNMVSNPGFENWTNGLPDSWVGEKTNIGNSNIIQYTANPHTGTSACQLVNETTSHKRFTTGAIALVAEQEYVITFWVRGAGEIRTGLFDATTGDYGYTDYNEYIVVNSAEWSQQTQTITSGGTVSNGEFIFSVRNTVAGNDHLVIDDVEITGGVVVLTANFSATPRVASPGATIQCTDLSSGNPTAWEWEISGPETLTSTEQNPAFTLNMAGLYNVSLTVSNGSETNTKVETGYISIANFLVNQDWNDLQWKGWTQVSVAGEQVWTISEIYGIDDSPCIKMSGYSGAPIVNEDWLISPSFNLNNNENVMLSFENAYKYEGIMLQAFISNDYDGDPENATWQELQFTPSTGNFAWTNSGNINLDQFEGDNCFIGFKYTCDASAAATWELDNIIISTASVAIAETNAVDFQLAPNPCNGQFNITIAEKANVSVFNVLGQMIHHQPIEGTSSIQLGHVDAGIYLVKIQTNTGATSTQKIIVR
ncbi:MAG: T9SS type A sorting domain-containing protein [Bacteroidales bacterium]|nr:T9SS type A sorting domain-containing protein [Bacteroidales bacterium]